MRYQLQSLCLVLGTFVLLALSQSCAEGVRVNNPKATSIEPSHALANVSAPGWHVQSLDVDGARRWFRIYVPPRLAQNSPVILLLHGGPQSMRQIFRPNAGGTREWPALADQHNFLLLVPNGTNPRSGNTSGNRQSWNGLRPDGTSDKPQANDVKFLSHLLDWAERTYPIDPRRVYATGVSNGGLMTYRLLLEIPDRIAAGAVFIAHLPTSSPIMQTTSPPRPVMIVSGTRDPLMPWQGGSIADGRGQVYSAEQTVQWWVQHNKARAGEPQVSQMTDADSPRA